ncbi:uncharacterized protein LOC110978217 [Acanthaster planci]|uniref:Uncharacterized protein LOC110978217 n=1 Tax=Acanthaster planci TaxID=133434 RepID=A0A8B7YAJ8_ACAPL|nr:uncharacterized protein LOC110978217 [Acanthaster planci]XP_022088726.1 uncharacterized protein LOC110978217 [Acanthaster planci]
MATNYNYSPGCGVCLGVFHILFGLGSCACGVAAIVLHAYVAEIAVGIWAGVVFYAITGILALASSTRNNSVITAYYVMALLSVFVSMGQMGLYVWAVINEVWTCFDSLYWQFNGSCTETQIRDLIMHAILLLLAFLEWIIAMVSCCTACTCCFNNDVAPTQTVVIHSMQQPVLQPLPTQGGPAVVMPPPQAEYVGSYSGGGVPTNIAAPPAPGYSEKPQLPPYPAAGDPLVYHNPTFDQAMPSGDISALPHPPQAQTQAHNNATYY